MTDLYQQKIQELLNSCRNLGLQNKDFNLSEFLSKASMACKQAEQKHNFVDKLVDLQNRTCQIIQGYTQSKRISFKQLLQKPKIYKQQLLKVREALKKTRQIVSSCKNKIIDPTQLKKLFSQSLRQSQILKYLPQLQDIAKDSPELVSQFKSLQSFIVSLPAYLKQTVLFDKLLNFKENLVVKIKQHVLVRLQNSLQGQNLQEIRALSKDLGYSLNFIRNLWLKQSSQFANIISLIKVVNQGFWAKQAILFKVTRLIQKLQLRFKNIEFQEPGNQNFLDAVGFNLNKSVSYLQELIIKVHVFVHSLIALLKQLQIPLQKIIQLVEKVSESCAVFSVGQITAWATPCFAFTTNTLKIINQISLKRSYDSSKLQQFSKRHPSLLRDKVLIYFCESLQFFKHKTLRDQKTIFRGAVDSTDLLNQIQAVGKLKNRIKLSSASLAVSFMIFLNWNLVHDIGQPKQVLKPTSLQQQLPKQVLSALMQTLQNVTNPSKEQSKGQFQQIQIYNNTALLFLAQFIQLHASATFKLPLSVSEVSAQFDRMSSGPSINKTKLIEFMNQFGQQQLLGVGWFLIARVLLAMKSMIKSLSVN